MKFIPLHKKNTTIVYKNALCSSATVLVLVFIVLSVMLPLLLVSILSPYSGIAESRLLYEQPLIKFKHEFIFLGITEQKSLDYEAPCSEQTALVACSTMNNLNARLQPFARNCEGHKYWSSDTNLDGRIDYAYFQLKLDSLLGQLKYFDIMLFFEAELKHKCQLRPPALLAQRITLPATMHSGRLVLKAELQLKQHVEFMCPFPGRKTQTHFRDVELAMGGVHANQSTDVDLTQFLMENLLKQLKINSAYFQLELQETYVHAGEASQQLEIELQLHVLQVPARYHLSVWERLGQFWLYFASFFGISFYIMNKLKDFLFSRHIIRAWEVIPWKKLY